MAHRHKHEAPGVVDPASLGEPGSISGRDRLRQPIAHRHKHEAPGVADPASLGEGGLARRLQEKADSTPDKEQSMQRKDKVEGEGSYSGSKDYNERTQKFVDSGKVDEAARKAAPKNEQEKQAMQKAERVGKQHAKGEDPALRDPKKIPDDPNFPRKK